MGDTVRFIEISVLLYFTFLWWSLCSFFKAVLVVNTHSTQCTSTAVTKTQRALGWRVVLHAWRRVRWRYYCGVNTQLTITQLSPQTCTLQWLWMHYSGLANRITWFVAAYCASSFPAIQPPSESSSGFFFLVGSEGGESDEETSPRVSHSAAMQSIDNVLDYMSQMGFEYTVMTLFLSEKFVWQLERIWTHHKSKKPSMIISINEENVI